MPVKMILCTDKNGGLGKDGNLSWGNSYPEDLQYFKKQTLNSPVVMGRKTFESLPFENGLPCRDNIVVTDNYDLLDLVGSDIAYNHLDSVKQIFLDGDPCIREEIFWIIGGKSIYEQLFPYVEEIHHSIIIDKEYDCDTFMDVSLWQDNPRWEEVRCEQLSDSVIVNVWRKV